MSTRTWIVLLVLAVVLAACGGKPEEETSGTTPKAEPGTEPARPPAGGGEPEGAFVQVDAFIAEQGIDKTNPRWKLALPEPPQLSFDPGVTWTWVLQTNQGTMRFRLLPEVAPMHVSSTIYLTRLGFYDGIKFHRVIQDFMAQGGDPLGVGSGGPGYQYSGEFSPEVRHDRGGLLSMANAGPGTDGSQFFITFKATPWLDGKHTIFGQVVEGEDVVRKLNDLGQPGNARNHTPKEPIVIEKATIEVR